MFIKYRKRSISIEDTLARIKKANDKEVQQIVDAIIHRYSIFFPDWEVMFFSMHKEPQQRAKDIDDIIQIFQIMKEKVDSR